MEDVPAAPPKTGDSVSNTRLYLGNLPRNVAKADVEAHFNTHGAGEITEIKLMNGFGFIEYKDALDARDVVPAFHGSNFMGERLVVQFARGSTRPRDGYEAPRPTPRPRRTIHRMTITGLPVETSWQDLKDFARNPGLDVVYSEIGRERDAEGRAKGFVEYETAADLVTAVDKLNESTFKDTVVHCIVDTQSEVPRPAPRERYARSRSPGGYRGQRGYGGPPPPHPADYDYYDRRGPPRGYSPRRDDGYRRRTPPPPRDYYQDDRGYPPRRGPHPEEYAQAPRGRYDDRGGYGGPPPAPRGPYDQDPYHQNGYGHGREPPPYQGRQPSPRRDGRGPGGGYDRGYDARPHW